MNQNLPESDPRYHTQKVKGMFDDLIQHLREDIEKIDEPQAKAMFETSAEVIGGLKKAFEHYERNTEQAWR
jgi:hypothetical protein